MFLLSRVCSPLPLNPLKSKLHKKPTTKKEVSPNKLLQKLRNILNFGKLVFQFYFLLLKYKNRQLTLIFASSAFPSSSCKLLFITVSVITEVRVLYFGPVCKSFEPETVRARFIITLIKRFGSLRRNDCAILKILVSGTFYWKAKHVLSPNTNTMGTIHCNVSWGGGGTFCLNRVQFMTECFLSLTIFSFNTWA